MKLENQVTSLELSKRLKELGIKQDSLFWWIIPTDSDYKANPKNKSVLIYEKELCRDGNCGHKPISAFTVSELGELLPKNLKYKDGMINRVLMLDIVWNKGNGWIVGYQLINQTEDIIYQTLDKLSLADAMSKMLISLKDLEKVK